MTIERNLLLKKPENMIKQSNIKFDLELATNFIKKTNQSMGNNYNCQRFAARHGFIVTTTTKQSQLTNKSKISRSSNHLTHEIQETNVNTTTIDIIENSSSHCSLIEPSFKERLDKYLKKDSKNSSIITSETKENLNKLQKITDDVKFLTKQLQLSINKNNNSSFIVDERLIGEICYQLERRILIIIFSPLKQFYGYSLRYLSLIIENEENKSTRFLYKKRFLQIEKYLLKTNFQFNYHSILTFNLINKYGIYFDYQWLNTNLNNLSNINQIKSYTYSFLSENLHQDFHIILHSLELISNFDGKPLFYW